MNSFQTNVLDTETSPYLLQHANNPVHWQVWSEQTLEYARQQQKPILLSIGYSACHWCHVMAHESFENEASAEVMNTLFVNIKVDREERPDLDKIYQTAHQLLTRQGGGWPLTVFLEPDQQIPFFAGTYFPETARYGRIAFTDLLRQIAAAWEEKRVEIQQQGQAIYDALEKSKGNAQGVELSSTPVFQAYQELKNSFDALHGGFGKAPKFPHPGNLQLLMNTRWWEIGSELQEALQHCLLFTLQRMASGGVCDQIGGGFFRYSVDERWMIPHFEKMLYDNALLLPLYAQTWHWQKVQSYADTAHAVASWLITEMQSPEGGYYATQDADSDTGEGAFYVWNNTQVADIVSRFPLFAKYYGLEGSANFEASWHLHSEQFLEDFCTDHALDRNAIRTQFSEIAAQLQQQRNQRIAPGRDDKILTAWNALMVKGMLIAGVYLDTPAYLDSACHALDFIRQKMYQKDRLLASYKEGEARFMAYLDDHAFLLDALLQVLQVRWQQQYLDWAIELAEQLANRFADPLHGGFFFTAHDHEKLYYRPKNLMDDALPSGNGVAAKVLNRLGCLLGEPRYLELAEQCVRYAWREVSNFPSAYGSMLLALEEQLQAPRIIILGGKDREQVKIWQEAALRSANPHCLTFSPEPSAALPEVLQSKQSNEQDVIAWPCQGLSCQKPLQDFSAFCLALED